MALNLGVDAATAAFVGSDSVSKLYLGSDLVADYSATPSRAFIRDVGIAYHLSTANTNEVANRPANVVAGDLLLLITVADFGAITAFTPPTGFAHPTGTAELVGGSNLVMVSISQKVATGSEPTTYQHGAYSTGADGISLMYAIGNVGAAASTRVTVATSASSTTTLTSPTVTPVTTKNLNLRGTARDFGGGGGTFTPGSTPAGYTLVRSDQDPGKYTWVTTYSRDYDSTTATGTQAFPFTVSPATAAAGLGWNVVVASA